MTEQDDRYASESSGEVQLPVNRLLQQLGEFGGRLAETRTVRTAVEYAARPGTWVSAMGGVYLGEAVVTLIHPSYRGIVTQIWNQVGIPGAIDAVQPERIREFLQAIDPSVYVAFRALESSALALLIAPTADILESEGRRASGMIRDGFDRVSNWFWSSKLGRVLYERIIFPLQGEIDRVRQTQLENRTRLYRRDDNLPPEDHFYTD